MINVVKSFKEYGIQFEKVGSVERCYVWCCDGTSLKKICVGSQSLDQKVRDPQLLPLAEVVTCFEGEQLLVSVLGVCPTLIRVLDDTRADGRRFMVLQSFNEDVFLQCFRQSHQDVFGMLEVTTALEYVIHRMKGSLYEDWTEDRPLLRKCIREGSVAFSDLRNILSDVIELRPSIRPYICYTGHPYFKSTIDRVSPFFCVLLPF